jgi:hypothetical protein
MEGFLDYALFISRVEATAKQQGQDIHRKRLAERLALFGFKQVDVTGDGNCQFHAVSRQLSNNFKGNVGDISHLNLRKKAVEWLRQNPEWNPWKEEGCALHNFVDEEWGRYCDRMAKSGTWGDHITLIALVEILNVGIRIISSVVGDQFMTEIDPSSKSGDSSLGRSKVLFLGHRSEFHYVSLVEDGDMMMSISTLPGVSKVDVKQVELAHSNLFLFNDPPKLKPKPRRVIKVNNVRVNQTRRYNVAEWPKSLAELHHSMKDIFAKEMLAFPYFLQYRDEKGGFVSLTEDADLRKFFESTDKKEKPLAYFQIGRCKGETEHLLESAKSLQSAIEMGDFVPVKN